MNIKYFFIFYFISMLLFCQKNYVVKIHDTNLFELQDSTLISLAGLEIPPLNCDYPPFQLIANDAKTFAEIYILDRNLEIKIIDTLLINDSQLVYQSVLIKKYPFEEKNLNIQYLKEGLAKFFDNKRLPNREDYILAEEKAKRDEIGIWKFFNKDSIYNFSISSYCNETMSYNAPIFENKLKERITLTDCIGSVTAGVGGGILGFYVTGLVMRLSYGKISGEAGLGFVLLSFAIGYPIGNALAVYLTTKSWSDYISFPLMLISSTIGTALTFGVFAFSPPGFDVLDIFAFLIPGIFNTGYSYFMYQLSSSEENISGINQQLLFNQDIVFRIPVFQINF